MSSKSVIMLPYLDVINHGNRKWSCTGPLGNQRAIQVCGAERGKMMTHYEVMDKTPSRFATCGTSMKYLTPEKRRCLHWIMIPERKTRRACIEYLDTSLRRWAISPFKRCREILTGNNTTMFTPRSAHRLSRSSTCCAMLATGQTCPADPAHSHLPSCSPGPSQHG